jgi:threonine/homoserine/homoserine lactone efflux protein
VVNLKNKAMRLFERITGTAVVVMFLIYGLVTGYTSEKLYPFLLHITGIAYVIYSVINIVYDYNRHNKLDKWRKQQLKRTLRKVV